MSELIAAKAKGELLDRYQEAADDLGDDETESELVRDLLDRGLTAKELPLYVRLGFPNQVGAQLEDMREPGEGREAVLREVVEDGLTYRNADVLDKIDASDELREQVEQARDDGEQLDDTVRRLVRQGAAAGASDDTPDRTPWEERLLDESEVLVTMGSVFAVGTLFLFLVISSLEAYLPGIADITLPLLGVDVYGLGLVVTILSFLLAVGFAPIGLATRGAVHAGVVRRVEAVVRRYRGKGEPPTGAEAKPSE